VAKGRDSGMPPVEQWEAYFHADEIMDALGCVRQSGDVAEFGCGYGTFTIAAGRRVSGMVYAMDIDPLMVGATITRASQAGLRNVVVEQRDFVSAGCGRPDNSMSHVMLFNILHIEDPVGLLREAFRVVRTGGTVGVLHWRCDIETPRGPPLEIRPQPAQCRAWAEQAGLQWLTTPDLPGAPWHWGLKFTRPVKVD
jgi:ubiquinone/menaquinone biosynthesis C-methylase UbiE